MAQNMKHSILFGDGTLANGKFRGVDTYKDWHLVPSSRPTIAMPGIETKYVEIPGVDGSIDLSEFLRAGRPAYGNRSGSFNFYVENEHEFWMTIYPKITNYLHGRKFKMVLEEDDPDYYWEGRFTVDRYDPGEGNWSNVSISYNVRPFKRKIRKNSEGMVWDNFNFERDYDYSPLELENLVIDGSWTESINGDGYAFPLEVQCLSGSVNVVFGGEGPVTVAAGQTRNIGHAVYGPNTISITGTGTVKLDWRGGSL